MVLGETEVQAYTWVPAKTGILMELRGLAETGGEK